MTWIWTHLKANFLGSPKSTISGACGLIISITLSILLLPPKASAPLILVAVLRGVVDFTKQDAGKVLAKIPGKPDPELVPGHETPDNPAAVAVVEVDPPKA